jgi:DUF971 family protein
MSDFIPPSASAPLREKPLSLTAVAPFGTELAISWSDGVEQYLPLEKLRKACPCAVCNGEPDVMGRGENPTRDYKPGSFELKGYDFVGGYGLNLKWMDGHGTGIYSYNLLRSL